jgi:CelD/BcsL family acetyltransferase involved in cellulose biosynthesis
VGAGAGCERLQQGGDRHVAGFRRQLQLQGDRRRRHLQLLHRRGRQGRQPRSCAGERGHDDARRHHAADLERELAEGFTVEASGWKGEKGTAILSSPAATRFYRELAAAFAAEGGLRLSTLRVDGRAVAFDYCLLDHGRLWSLKLGIDDDFRRFAPGIVLTLAEIERCFELELRALELCGGDEEWKTRFATSARTHVNLWSFARNPVPLSYALYRRVRPSLVRAYRLVSDRSRSRSR